MLVFHVAHSSQNHPESRLAPRRPVRPCVAAGERAPRASHMPGPVRGAASGAPRVAEVQGAPADPREARECSPEAGSGRPCEGTLPRVPRPGGGSRKSENQLARERDVASSRAHPQARASRVAGARVYTFLSLQIKAVFRFLRFALRARHHPRFRPPGKGIRMAGLGIWGYGSAVGIRLPVWADAPGAHRFNAQRERFP